MNSDAIPFARRAASLLLGLLLATATAAQIPQSTLDDSLAGAVWLDDAEEALWALEHGANPNAKMKDGTPVLSAAIQELPEVAKALVRRGADPNTVGEWGSPVVCSAAGVSLELTKMLVDRGANLQVLTKEGHTPLTVAALADRPEIVTYLLGKGLPLEGKHNIEGYPDGLKEVTPLMVAAKYSAAGSMKVLLDAGADPKALSAVSVNALGYAVSGFAEHEPNAPKILAAMDLLLNRGAQVDQRISCFYFYSSWSPLTGYGTIGKPDLGFTPLMVATAFRWSPAVEFLLKRGADPGVRSQGGIPLLFWAALPYGDSIMDRLLKAGGDPEVEGPLPGYVAEKGVTALMVAAAVGTPETVAALLRAGADPNRVTAEGVPTLAFAWLGNMRREPGISSAIAQLLLDAGADAGGRPDPLHPERPWLPPLRAAQQGSWCEAAAWLLDHGADPGRKGSDGISMSAEFSGRFRPESLPAGASLEQLPDCFRRLIEASR